MILIIDNYDSFTYNIVQYFQILKQQVSVYANDNISIEEINALNPDGIVISPGPNAPEDAGVSLPVIQNLYSIFPILGVCLGHQCLAQAFGAKIIQSHEIMHGKTSLITHNRQGLFENIPRDFYATRYHSLMIDENTLSNDFRIDARTNKTIMAISHLKYPLFGLQFHPEAILTEYGMDLLQKYCDIISTNKLIVS